MKDTITLRDYINAIRKNGWLQTFGSMYHYNKNNRVYKACAHGQAMLNLNVYDDNGHTKYHYDYAKDASIEMRGIIALVFTLNDHNHNSLDRIADVLETEYKDNLDGPFLIKVQ